MKLTRSAVYAILDTERQYQEAKFPQGNTLGESVALFNKYIARLNATYTKSPGGTEASMEIIRKLGGIAVRAMEENGATARTPFGTAR
jgi:hypothetical protein